MRSLRSLVVLLVSVSVSSVAAGQVVFSEDFESYAVGTDLHHVGGWDGWNDAASASAPVSDDFARSGSKSVEILGTTDLVQIFDAAGGQWEFTAWMYIPSGGTGVTWFIMLNTYSHNGTQDWSVQTQFNLDTGEMTSSYDAAASADVVYDRWFEVEIVIDLDENTVTEYYDGELFTTHQWDDNNHGTIQVVDLFGNGASSVYYDDIELRQVGEPSLQAANPDPADGAVNVAFPLLQWTPGPTAVTHDVYLGTSPDLTAADLVSAGQQSLMYFHMFGVEPGQTYYWRVDEIEADETTVHEGEVWSFTVTPETAHSPDPVDGYGWAFPDVTLAWQAGQGASSHKLYFGSDPDAVANRNPDTLLDDLTLDVLTYDLSGLEDGTTYYWAVDEVAGGVTHEGDLWSFSTMPALTVTDPALLGWWSLVEGAGTTAVDRSGQGNHGTLNGDPEWVDGALTFDGRDDFVSVPLDVSETEYAAALWFQTTNGNCGIMAVVDTDRGSSHDRHIYLTGGNVATRLWDNEVIQTAGLNLADGLWHHVAYTYGGAAGGQKIYVDGVLQISGSKNASDFDWQERINIGFSHDAAQDFFEGVMEEVRVYEKGLSADEVLTVMRGDASLAGNPEPPRGAIVDIRDATTLRWSAGNTAASHNVYFGAEWSAVSNADTDAPEFRGNRSGTSLSLTGLAEFGGGDYYWRIDEVQADGTVRTGRVWRFTIPAYLIVDNFESYRNTVGMRAFETWIDGIGFTLPEPGNAGNGTGAAIGHDVWSPESRYYNGQIMEIARPHGAGQALPLYYDNTLAPFYSETERTWATAQNWTVEDVDTLSLWVRGRRANGQDDLYVGIEDSSGNLLVVVNPDPEAVLNSDWAQWTIALSDLADAGVNPAAVKKMYIGVGSRTAPAVGGSGVLTIDDIQVIKGQ